ncbi:MAG: Ig-like domain-containing protein [Candidatus Methylomirabilales bacterium]
MPQTKAISWSQAAAPPSPVAQEQRIATVSPPKADQPPPLPSPEPRVWKVLFGSPRAGAEELSRRTRITLFLNGPVERDVVEWAFTMSPSASGTFSWPRPDQLVFTPNDALRPATRYTVSLTPMIGFRDQEEYEIVETRWSFTTGNARTFRQDIQPLIGAYCTKCHGPKGDAAAVPLKTYGDVSRYVVPGRSGESRFYTFIQNRHHHINMADRDHSTNVKLAIIKDWIDEDKAVE